VALDSTGVYDVYVDLPQQKLKVVGRTDPETLVKAIKKTKKIATICSYTDPGASEPSSPPQPPPPSTKPEASSSPPATDAAAQPASETPPPAEATPPTEPPKDGPPQENQAPDEPKPSPKAQGMPSAAESKDVDERHMVHNYPHGHVIREHWNNYPPPMGPEIHYEAPYYATHSYNTYRPSPYVSEHAYVQSPPRDMIYHSVESYDEGYYQNRGREEYYQNRGSDGNQITSMFSDENPNACTIV